jgi:xanthine dehydrogenase accessory factor
MQSVAALVEAWHHQQRSGAVARVIATEGLGPQHRDELLLVDADGRTGGSLLGGALRPEVAAAAKELLGSGGALRLLTLDIDGGDATAAGLTCGGVVHLLLQRVDEVPQRLWDSFAAGRLVALVTPLAAGRHPLVVHAGGDLDGTLGSSGLDTIAQAEAEALLARPGAGVERLHVGDLELVIEAWDPTPRVVIVGASDLSAAVVRQAELIGWTASTVIHADAATDAIGALDHGDAVLVIDHDPFVATPALAAALRRRIGYVGALGSRRTQQHRRQLLTDIGVGDDAIDRLRGPAGLDLGARNPAETAVSIVAEMIATRAGRDGAALTASTGGING